MRVSVITPSFNQAPFIEQTIRSVLEQDHRNVEHIVVDGGSTDGTVEILKKYPHLRWRSERDHGQADAINKGFRESTGEIIAWINSDDYYAPRVFGNVVRYFREHPACGFLYGDIAFVDRAGTLVATFEGPSLSYQSLVACPDIVRQPSCFWKRGVMEEMGGVNEDLQLVMDLEFFLRIARRYPLHHLPQIISHYRTYAENKSRSQSRRQLHEFIKVYRDLGIPIGPSNGRFLLKKLLLTLRPVAALHEVMTRRRTMRASR